MSARSLDENLRALARRQHSVFTRRQATEIGFSKTQITDRRACGEWLTLERATYAIAGSADTFERRVMAAVLAACEGAAASHLTAARLLGLIENKPSSIHVTVPHGTKPPRGSRHAHHRSRTLDACDIAKASGIPVTRVDRTLVDLAGVLSQNQLEAVVDQALVKRLVTCDSLRMYLTERGLDNVRGSADLRRLLSDRSSGLLNKELERRFVRLIRTASLPEPIRQFRFGPYKIDFAYPDVKIAIEVDGLEAHASRAAFDHDRKRQNELMMAGWFVWTQVRWQPDVVANTVARALADRAGGGI